MGVMDIGEGQEDAHDALIDALLIPLMTVDDAMPTFGACGGVASSCQGL